MRRSRTSLNRRLLLPGPRVLASAGGSAYIWPCSLRLHPVRGKGLSYLPNRSNLEHLRKQAKALLPGLQRLDPAARLADAQHALAREYGFPSWATLKAHVEAATAQREIGTLFVGRWILNRSRSTLHPVSPFVSGALELDVAANTVVVRHTAVDDSGRTEQAVNILHADGQERDTGNGSTLLARWLGPRTLGFVARQGGRIVGQGSYEVAPDGRFLTITGEGQVVVCERAEPAT